MQRRRRHSWLSVVLTVGILFGHTSAQADLLAQDDPAGQCAEGVQLFKEKRTAEARLLLEAGFAGRGRGSFATSDDLGMCALATGLSRSNVGDSAGALAAYWVALQAFHGNGNRRFEGVILNNMGAVYESQGRYADALEAYQRALAIRREVGDRAGEGITLDNIGIVYMLQGRYAEALESNQRALAILREVGDRAGVGKTRSNIGMVYFYQGRYAEALESLQQALAIHREVGDWAGEGISLGNIGLVHHQQRRYAEALENYHQALAVHRAVGDRAGQGKVLNNIGGVYGLQGRYAEAWDVYQQALAIRREVGDRAGEGATLNNIGQVYHDQGRYAEALEAYRQALAIRREVGDRAGEGITLSNMGHACQQQGQLDQALAYYEQAMAVLDAMRAVAGSETGRAKFIAQHADLYDRAVGLYHRQGNDIEAFQTSEHSRARAFLDSLSTGYVELSDSQAASLLAREQETYGVRQAAQDGLARASGAHPPDATLVSDVEAQLAAAEKEYAAALAAIEARGDQLAALVPGRGAVLELPDVQALLDDQTTLVSFHVLGDEGSLAFVITRNDMQVVELSEATPQNLGKALIDLYAWPSTENPHPFPLQNLYRWLLAPFATDLTTRRVAFVPHQLLHYVPFAALTDGEHYFGVRYELSILPSASSLRFIKQNAAEPDGTGALVFGNPASDETGLKPLACAEEEATDVAGLLGVPAALGGEATEARTWAGAKGAKVIHLSAHGGYNTANPLYSTVYLAAGEGQDGRLETHEVYGLDLKGNEVVVLSACQTNVGELSAGDEVVGLTRAFFFAGAPTVISSLWAVDDAATGTLMTAFYRHWLQDGMSKAQALQAAQAEVRSDARWASPFYWAGFVLNGDPGEAQQQSPSLTRQSEGSNEKPSTKPPFLALGYVGAVLVAGLAVWLTTRRRVV